MTIHRQLLVCAGLATAAVSQATLWGGFDIIGGTIADNATLTSDITISGTNLIIDSLDQIVLAQITHSWVGDLRVRVTHLDSGVFVNLFQHVRIAGGTSGFGDDDNLGGAASGNYWFEDDTTLPTIESASPNTNANIADGFYRPVGQVDPNATTANNNTVFGSFAPFVGLAADATWRLEITDRAGGDTGTIAHWEIYGQGSPVPEPATIAALGLGAAALLRRRRKATV